jgi:hypothetical protein
VEAVVRNPSHFGVLTDVEIELDGMAGGTV